MDNKSEVLVRAPGRICLFGDHQDYLGLPIIACAINRYIEIKAVKNSSEYFHIDMPDIHLSRSFHVDEKFDEIEHEDFIASTIRVVRRYGCVPNEGYTITIRGNVPINAGLSSSSSVVVGWVHFLLISFGCDREITNELVAQISYEAEVVEHSSPGGRMDQYTIAIGGIIYLETDSAATFEQIKSPLEVLIVGESGVAKNTIGILGDLRGKALKSVEIIQKKVPSFELRNSILEDIAAHSHFLSEEQKPYFSAAIRNFSITKKALKALKKPEINLKQIGNLMNEHHSILKDDLKITTRKIDAMITAANEAGAYGVKIVGSGGGGSICALASKETAQKVMDSIISAGAKDAYMVQIVPGARLIQI